MSLSLPIINSIITEKIASLNDKLDSNDVFYKTTILNLTSQINLLIRNNQDLSNRLEDLENSESGVLEKEVLKKIKQPVLTKFMDKPPGLVQQSCKIKNQTNKIKTKTNKSRTTTMYSDGYTNNDNNYWQVVNRKKNSHRR